MGNYVTAAPGELCDGRHLNSMSSSGLEVDAVVPNIFGRKPILFTKMSAGKLTRFTALQYLNPRQASRSYAIITLRMRPIRHRTANVYERINEVFSVSSALQGLSAERVAKWKRRTTTCDTRLRRRLG